MRPSPLQFAIAGLSAALLAACGGGSDDPVATVSASTTTLTTTVVDGALANALVCLDRNDNGACDADEPSARTGTDGVATLSVDNADVGKYPVLALVGVDAVDAATGAVKRAYAMRTPADRTAVVSPLTTLVAAQSLADGSSSAEAEKVLQALVGSLMPFTTDYTKGTDSAATMAAAAARLLVLMKQQSNADPAWAAAVVGQTDASAPGSRRRTSSACSTSSFASCCPRSPRPSPTAPSPARPTPRRARRRCRPPARRCWRPRRTSLRPPPCS